MIYEYLVEEKKELEKCRDNIQRKVQTIKIDIKEMNQFIKILEERVDTQADIFTPLEPNKETYNKVRDLKQSIKEKQQLQEELEKKIVRYDDKIASIISVIERASILEEYNQEDNTTDKQNEKNGLGDLNHKGFRMKLLEIQEAERKRIAEDLHDSTVQELTALTHKLEFCSRLIDTDPIRSKLELMKASQNTRETINDMRKIIYDLRPMSLDDMGLKITLEREIERLEKESGVKIQLDMDELNDDDLSILKLTIYRIIREACINAIKHADATDIKIDCRKTEQNIEVRIIDDGKGFEPDKKVQTKEARKCFGLATMKERIYLLSGTLNIQSKVGEGTTIYVSIPISTEAK